MITNQIRTATVIATTDVQLAYIEEDHYRSLFKEQIERGLFLVDTLKSSFEDIQRSKAAELSYYFQSKEIFYKNAVYREGEEADSIYIIKSGQIELRQLGPDKREQSLSILTAGQFFGQEQGIGEGLKRVCTAYCKSNDTKIYYLRIQNLQLPQFEIFLQAFEDYSKKSIALLNRRRKQLIQCSQENLQQIKENNKKQQQIQNKSEERKKSIEKPQLIPLINIQSPKSNKAKDRENFHLQFRGAQTSKVSPRKKTISWNSKNLNKFFDAMHSMHEEKKHIRLQSQPQLRYQNMQKIIEQNQQYKKLQKQLSQQAPTIDLDKNNLTHIAQSMKSKGIAIGGMIKSGEQSISSKRRFKSLESILNTIANRENISLVQNSQINTSMNNNSSFSPENKRFLSPTLLQQMSSIQQFGQNNIAYADSSTHQEIGAQTFLNYNQGPASLIDINSMNQSLILAQTNSAGYVQGSSNQNLPINSNTNIQTSNSNNSPLPTNRVFGQTQARRMASNNDLNSNFQGLRVQTEDNLKKITKTLPCTMLANQTKYQIIQQTQNSNRSNNNQFPARFLRLKQQNGNTSLSIVSLGSSQQIPYTCEEDTIQQDTIQRGHSQKYQESQQMNAASINNSQLSLLTQRSQNKLNLHKKSQSFNKPYQVLQQEAAANILQKINTQSKQNINFQGDRDASTKLIKIMKVNDDSTPINSNQNNLNSHSPILFNIVTQPQHTSQVDFMDSNSTLPQNQLSPSSTLARERYIKILQGGSDQNLLSEESPTLLQNRLQQKLNHQQISQFNQKDQIIEFQQASPQRYAHQQIFRNSSQDSLFNQSTKTSYNKFPDQFKDSSNSSGQNSHKNTQKDTSLYQNMFQESKQELKQNQQYSSDNDLKQFQVISERNVVSHRDEPNLQKGEINSQKRKRSLNTFSDVMLNQLSLNLNQQQPQQLNLITQHSQPTSSRIQEMANSFYQHQQNKYLIYGNTINYSINYHQHSQSSIPQSNSTTSRLNYLDVKAETESIKQSIQLKKQKKLQGQQILKRKELIEKMMMSSKNNFQNHPSVGQNSLLINSVKDNEVANMDQNVITKLQQLFQKQKPSTTGSPTRSPIKLNAPKSVLSQHITLNDGEYVLNRQEIARYQNTSVREQTEGEETTPAGKKVIPLAAKSYSFSNRFTYRQQINNFQNQDNKIQEKAQNQIDMIDQKQRSLSKLLNRKVITESGVPLRVNTQGLSLTCRNHIHNQQKAKQSLNNENNRSKNCNLQESISTLNIDQDQNTQSTQHHQYKIFNNTFNQTNNLIHNKFDLQRFSKQQTGLSQKQQLELSTSKNSIFQNSLNQNSTLLKINGCNNVNN